jgi:hypothetical protein
MNKTECLALLDKIKSEISVHQWEAQVEESTFLLDHQDMKSYMTDFNLPEAEMAKDFCIRLPKDWIEDVDPESTTYLEVVEKYEDVYYYLLSEASREVEALNMIDARDEKAMLRQSY